MDADERVTALKRAYADIILNTVKEAAARIMVSERKAVGFQHELNVAKEQALQTLLRLKQMMDSKGGEAGMTYLSQQKMIEELKVRLQEAEYTINEADMASLSQRKKIEELEAQLEEAEDIVNDLREELREVQAELERVRKSTQHVDENDIVTKEQTSQANKLIASQSVAPPPAKSELQPFTTSDTKNSAFYQGNEFYECNGVNYSCILNSRTSIPDLSSTSEENRLNTSRSIVSPHPDSGLNSPTASGVKNSASNQRNEVSKGYGNSNGFAMGNSNIRKPEVPSVILRSNEPTPYRNRRTQRILAFEEKLMAGELAFSETRNDMNYETSGRKDGEDEGIRKTSIKKKDAVWGTKAQNHVQKVNSFRHKRKRATRYKKIETLSSRNLSNDVVKSDQTISCAETISINISAQSCGDSSNMATRPSVDKENEVPLGFSKIAEHDAKLDKAVIVENVKNKDEASIDELKLMRHDRGLADSLGVMISRTDVEKVNAPVGNPQTKMSELSNGIPSVRETGSRVIKFTFQRKRKRESMVNRYASLEESIPLEKAAEKHNVMLETEKSSSLSDPPQESRLLAQVARQLVYLSEKKW